SAGSGLALELVESRQYVVGVQLRWWPLSEPCCLVAFVVDFREAADLAAVGLGLVQGGGRHDGAGQAVAADRVVQVDFVDRGSFVSEGRSEEHTSELQSRENLVCRLLLE